MPESRTVVVVPRTFERVIREAGVIEATRVVSIVAPDRAKLLLLPETGTLVRKGDPVMVLDTTRASENLERTLNELQQLKTELEANIETLKIAMRENLLDLDLAESELAYSTVKLEDTKVKLAETELLLQRSVVPEDDPAHSPQPGALSASSTAITSDLTLRSQETAKASAELDNLASISQKNLRGDRLVRRVMDAKAEIDAATVYAEVSGIFVRSRSWSWRQRRMEEPRPGEEVPRRPASWSDTRPRQPGGAHPDSRGVADQRGNRRARLCRGRRLGRTAVRGHHPIHWPGGDCARSQRRRLAGAGRHLLGSESF